MSETYEHSVSGAPLHAALDESLRLLDQAREAQPGALALEESGRVSRVSESVVFVEGLPGAQSDEVLRFSGNRLGMAFNLDPGEIGAVMLDPSAGIEAGQRVRRTGRVMDVPVGDELLGRVVDPHGRPRDGRKPPRLDDRLPIEGDAPSIMSRSPVEAPLQTGLKVVDALVPIGRGQRELILGDRQTGKTAIALDTISNQKHQDVLCVYCAVGQRASAVAKVVAQLREQGAMDYTVCLVTTGDDPPGLQFTAPYAAMSVAEHFMSRERDVLVVFDDLTRHARAYRELSLLLRRPPGREAYPGDIFYIHSRLLERATHLRDEHGGGSVTALPIIETQAQNLSAYIPTNLISITDGQVYLSPRLFEQGVLPAVDVGRSVSRVGGDAQLPAYKRVAGDLKLTYAQFEELERFSRYGTRLEAGMRRQLERGRRVREVLKQGTYAPVPPGEQVAVLLAVIQGATDDVPRDAMADAEHGVRQAAREDRADLLERIEKGEDLTDEQQDALLDTARDALKPLREQDDGDDSGTS